MPLPSRSLALIALVVTLAIASVRHAAIEAERRGVELDRLAVVERHRRVRKVGVRKNVVDRRARAGHHRGGGEQLLFAVGERVRRRRTGLLCSEPRTPR